MLRSLVLIRHAKSSWATPGLPDIERTLNDRGLRDGPVMAAAYPNYFTLPEQVICSPAKRTLATLDFFKGVFGLSEESIRIEPSIYEAHVEDLLRAVAGTSPDVRHLAMIGHNPGLSMLCMTLAPSQSFEGLPTLGIAEIEIDLEDWGMVLAGVTGRRVRYLTPKTLPVS